MAVRKMEENKCQIELVIGYNGSQKIRHTSISLQIANGIQVQIISKRAGHSNVTVTHNTYSHFFDSGFKEVASKMDDFLKVGKFI